MHTYHVFISIIPSCKSPPSPKRHLSPMTRQSPYGQRSDQIVSALSRELTIPPLSLSGLINLAYSRYNLNMYACRSSLLQARRQRRPTEREIRLTLLYPTLTVECYPPRHLVVRSFTRRCTAEAKHKLGYLAKLGQLTKT